MIAAASGYRRVKNSRTDSASSGSIASNPCAPWNGQKIVQVKVRSALGSAIIIEPPRGQMCRA